MAGVIDAGAKAPPRLRGRAVLGVVRGFVTVHAVAIFAQPVLAGRYLIGDYDMLALHASGADLVSYLALAQLVPAALLWRRGGPRWPFWASVLSVLGVTGQYFAGLAGALDLHVPLGVVLVALAWIMLFGIWRTGARR
ncbi:hypothetical protein FHS29_005107 [Saccharothrix tamanrassetensis]|uniref:Uncharacterized protein n=1 Tax=Saccharothrix tamanrassetensis TaxID=1051531 RepID=A0A841CMH8_9PSEU|nr:hypothetical protein [Saccharothrix tamanrassetensis]MBB5958499.1 hypothetical protein [Saccharothrix tamanrassetensis]